MTQSINTLQDAEWYKRKQDFLREVKSFIRAHPGHLWVAKDAQILEAAAKNVRGMINAHAVIMQSRE